MIEFPIIAQVYQLSNLSCEDTESQLRHAFCEMVSFFCEWHFHLIKCIYNIGFCYFNFVEYPKWHFTDYDGHDDE
jgi:hypothetical protein